MDDQTDVYKDEMMAAVWSDHKIHNLHSLETDNVCLDKTNDPRNFGCRRIMLLGKHVSIFPKWKISSVDQDSMP